MGCQDLLENVPGRSRVAGSSPICGSPGDLKSFSLTRVGLGIHGRGVAGKYLRNEELCSEYEAPCWDVSGTWGQGASLLSTALSLYKAVKLSRVVSNPPGYLQEIIFGWDSHLQHERFIFSSIAV